MTQIDNISATRPKTGNFFVAYQQTLPAVFRHPATWLLALLWVLATGYLLTVGKATPLGFLVSGMAILLALVAIPLTQGAPAAPWEGPVSSSMRWRLWLQCCLTILCVVALVLLSLLATLQIPIPLLIPFYAVLRSSGIVRLLLAFVSQAVLPLVLVFLLGARWRELGFQKGHHSGRTTGVLSIPFIVYIVFAIIVRKITLPLLLLRFVLLFVQAGLSEEIAWRGVIMSRLTRLLGIGWGIALSSLIFGIFHVATNIFLSGSTPLVGLAQGVFGQMPAGIFLAVVFYRTRSLIPVIIPHTLTDTAVSILLAP